MTHTVTGDPIPHDGPPETCILPGCLGPWLAAHHPSGILGGAHPGPAEDCANLLCVQQREQAAQAATPDPDRQARRDRLTALVRRTLDGKLLSEPEAFALAGCVNAEQDDGDQARVQLATARAGAKERADLLEEARDALEQAGQNGPHGDDWPDIAPGIRALAEQLTAAKAGDAPWIKAYGEDIAAAEQRAKAEWAAHEEHRRSLALLHDLPAHTGWLDVTRAAVATRRGEAEAVRARKAAEEAERRAMEQRQEMAAERYAWQERGDRAERERDAARKDAAAARIRSGRNIAVARRNRDAWRNARRRAADLGRQLADMTTDRDGWWACAEEQGETIGRRLEAAEATLTAVRKAVAGAKACPGDEYCTVDHRDIITDLIDNSPTSLGDPQPATEAECPCGTGGVGDYEGPTRDCPIHGEQPAEPDWTVHLRRPCGEIGEHPAHRYTRSPYLLSSDAYGCPGVASSDLRTQLAVPQQERRPNCRCATTVFTLPGGIKPAEPLLRVHLDNRGATYEPWPQEWRANPTEDGKSEYRRNVEREAEQRVTVYGISVNEWDRLWLTVQAIADAAGVKPE